MAQPVRSFTGTVLARTDKIFIEAKETIALACQKDQGACKRHQLVFIAHDQKRGTASACFDCLRAGSFSQILDVDTFGHKRGQSLDHCPHRASLGIPIPQGVWYHNGRLYGKLCSFHCAEQLHCKVLPHLELQ